MKDRSKTVAVLCTTGSVDAAKLAGTEYLHVSFADVTDERRQDAFCMEQAMQIRAFLDGRQETAELFFCCDSGESRSAALAAAWMHYCGQNEMQVWKNVTYHPNELVYYLQSAACGLPVTREDARELAQFNEMLFHKAIKNQYQ